jgi:hypothetical protein
MAGFAATALQAADGTDKRIYFCVRVVESKRWADRAF